MVNSIPYQLNKRATIFKECPSNHILPSSVNVTVITNATLTPDPVKSNETVTVTGSATLSVSVTKSDLFTFAFFDSNDTFIEGGGGAIEICNPDCPTNTYPLNLKVQAPPELPSNYSIILAISGNPVPNRVTKACGFASGLSS
ncbi:18875_t:CDS:1 [Gigaspora rosea]|nr:18875_t:CDS:1 [Gigaspora rosea]